MHMIRSKSTAHKRSGSHVERVVPEFDFVVRDPAELDERDKVDSKQTYRRELGCLYNNKSNMRPALYSSLKYTVLPSVKLRRDAPDSHAKQIVYRSLFKNCYSNMEDRRFSENLSLFHDHFVRLCNNVYPFTMLKTEFPDYLTSNQPNGPSFSSPSSVITGPGALPASSSTFHQQHSKDRRHAEATKVKRLAKNPTQPRLRHPSNIKAVSKPKL